MKKKCDHCKGKGGWNKTAGRFNLFISCAQCKGKGVWYTNARPKTKRVP